MLYEVLPRIPRRHGGDARVQRKRARKRVASERAARKGTEAIRHKGGAGRPRRIEHREDLRHLLRATGAHDLRELRTYVGMRPMFIENEEVSDLQGLRGGQCGTCLRRLAS